MSFISRFYVLLREVVPIVPINRLIILCGGESGHIKDLLQG
jgi:hypothetical protein